jgi:translation initiation factor 1
MAKETGIVYSTEHGRMCPQCGKPAAECVCRKGAAIPHGDGIVRVSRETKGRKGKTMTLVTGVPLDEPGLQKLATELKRRCGAGGTVKEGVIEIQGDHRDLVSAELTRRGYTVKLAGG